MTALTISHSSMLKPNKVSSSVLCLPLQYFPIIWEQGWGEDFSHPNHSPYKSQHMVINFCMELLFTLKSNHSKCLIWGPSEQESNFPKLHAESDTVRSCVTWVLNPVRLWWWALSCFISVSPTLVLLNRNQILPSPLSNRQASLQRAPESRLWGDWFKGDWGETPALPCINSLHSA